MILTSDEIVNDHPKSTVAMSDDVKDKIYGYVSSGIKWLVAIDDYSDTIWYDEINRLIAELDASDEVIILPREETNSVSYIGGYRSVCIYLNPSSASSVYTYWYHTLGTSTEFDTIELGHRCHLDTDWLLVGLEKLREELAFKHML